MTKKVTSRSVQMSTKLIREILDHPYYQSPTGRDYEPIKEELERELYLREQKELERMIKERTKAEKAMFREMASAHKKSKNPVKNDP